MPCTSHDFRKRVNSMPYDSTPRDDGINKKKLLILRAIEGKLLD